MPNLAKANLLARKTRSFITIFGISIAVALMLVLVGMVNGTVRDLANRILNIGADIMVGSSDIGMFYPSEVLSDKYAGVLKEIEGVDKVTPVLIESLPSMNGNRQFNYIYGIDYDDYEALGNGFIYLKGGKFENENDIIIDSEMATINDIDIGDTVDIFNTEWKVVGIVKEALGARFYAERENLTRVFHPGRRDVATVFFINAKNGTDVHEVAENIRVDFDEEDFSVQNVRELFDSFISGAIGLKEFMYAVIGVSAIICFSVILLSMYNAIIERTREIGILKSLGATKGFIIGLILKEAFVINVIGISIGYFLTIVGMNIVSSIFPLVQVEITAGWMINSAFVAVLATLIGTLYPAWRASSLDPVEALSWE